MTTQFSLVLSTQLKYIRQSGNLPQIGVNVKHMNEHHHRVKVPAAHFRLEINFPDSLRHLESTNVRLLLGVFSNVSKPVTWKLL